MMITPQQRGLIFVNSVCFLDMNSLPRKRNSRDKTGNNFGKLLLDFCKSNDFFILNGRLNGDVEGKLKRDVKVRVLSTIVYVM